MSKDSFGITPKQAKPLTHRNNQPYYMIEDRDGQEWFVETVLDNGRMMELFRPKTNHRDCKFIYCDDGYKDYKIIIEEKDFG